MLEIKAIGNKLKDKAASKLTAMAAQHASPGVIEAAQRIFSKDFRASDLVGIVLGLIEDEVNPSLGHMTPRQLREIQERIRAAGPAMRNLFYLRITDGSPPPLGYGGIVTASDTIDLLALDVSYGANTITGDKIPIGSAVMDRPTGTDPVEMQITTMDDERGTIKRWFDGKCAQVSAPDGSFGLPSNYCVNIEVVHGLSTSEVDFLFTQRAYSVHYLMRPVSIQHDMSRRDQTPQEIQMTFTQADTWRQPNTPRASLLENFIKGLF